jgi:hypothetical protein
MEAKPMKNILLFKKTFLLCLAIALCSPLMRAKDPSRTVDFSGKWVLDFSQTKNPPPGLQNYSMAVSQDGQQLKVETSVKGELQPAISYPSSGGSNPAGAGYPGGSSGGYPGGRRGGGGMGSGGGMGGRMGMDMPAGMGMPGGGGSRGGRSRPESRPQGGIAAYTLYPSSAVYKLDGSESRTQLGDPNQTDAIVKADWAKDGMLKFSLVGNGDSGQRSGKIQMKDQWKLSGDRQFLMVERSVHSPGDSGTVHLVFRKQSADPNKDAHPVPTN